MPVCDQLAECLLLPTHFRPAIGCHVVTTFSANTYGNRTAGAIPAASTGTESTTPFSMRRNSAGGSPRMEIGENRSRPTSPRCSSGFTNRRNTRPMPWQRSSHTTTWPSRWSTFRASLLAETRPNEPDSHQRQMPVRLRWRVETERLRPVAATTARRESCPPVSVGCAL